MPEVEVSLEEEEPKMADLADDRTSLILSESLQNHSSLMHGTRANEQSAHNIGRHSSIRKFDKEDPIEAASVEMILNIAQV